MPRGVVWIRISGLRMFRFLSEDFPPGPSFFRDVFVLLTELPVLDTPPALFFDEALTSVLASPAFPGRPAAPESRDRMEARGNCFFRSRMNDLILVGLRPVIQISDGFSEIKS